MKNLSTKGLSMSQAQSISNLCNQRAQDIKSTIGSINNAEKTITIDREKYVMVQGMPMPKNISQMLFEKAQMHACQAFLMEAIKEKDALMDAIVREQFTYESAPQREYLDEPELLSNVTEEWGWAQLSVSEHNEYLEQEAYASHIGQFIHRGGQLDMLRRELSNLSTIEWKEIEMGKKTPVKVVPHHNSKDLLTLHESLAQQHRNYEQRVNYFKAKVKNLVTEENARIARHNGDLLSERKKAQAELDQAWTVVYTDWSNARDVAEKQFEAERQERIKYAAALRINVDARFQAVVDFFLTAE